MKLPSIEASIRDELRTFLSRWAVRYHPDQDYQQRLIERTILVVTNNPTELDDADISRTLIAVLHRLAVAQVLQTAGEQSVPQRRYQSVYRYEDNKPFSPVASLPPSQTLLAGRRCLVVEDEYHVASSLLDILEAAGATVFGPVSNVKRAIEVLADPTFELDVAILDINLNGQMVYPAATLLAKRGTPFVFVTGYEELRRPEEFAQTPCVIKPFDNRTLLRTLSAAVI